MSTPSDWRTKNATPSTHGEGHPRPERARVAGGCVRCLCRPARLVAHRPSARARRLPDPDRRASRCPRAAEVPSLDHRRGRSSPRPPVRTRIRAVGRSGRGTDYYCRPKDDELIALHRSCQADLLVSGHSDLLELAAEDVDVLTPGARLERLRPSARRGRYLSTCHKQAGNARDRPRARRWSETLRSPRQVGQRRARAAKSAMAIRVDRPIHTVRSPLPPVLVGLRPRHRQQP